MAVRPLGLRISIEEQSTEVPWVARSPVSGVLAAQLPRAAAPVTCTQPISAGRCIKMCRPRYRVRCVLSADMARERQSHRRPFRCSRETCRRLDDNRTFCTYVLYVLVYVPSVPYLCLIDHQLIHYYQGEEAVPISILSELSSNCW